MRPMLASLFQAVELRQPIPPLLIGERTNANGSKLFRERLLAEDYEGCLSIGQEQEAGGAHVLDLCAAYAGRDERRDMMELVARFARSIKVPLMIDSTSPEVIEACLQLYPGRCVINSINLEDGGLTARRVCGWARKYGAAVVALAIDEQGMAMHASHKLAVAQRLYDLAVNGCGLRPADLLFDPLTFTVGSGDPSLRDAAIQTLEALRAIKGALPGVATTLGISNISFGLPPLSRRVLNSVFLHEAVRAGLDAAIVDAGKVIPLAQIPDADRQACLDLLLNRSGPDGAEPVSRFIAHFGQASEAQARQRPDDTGFKSAEDALFKQALRGIKEGVEDHLAILLERMTPLEVINRILVPAMRQVGELFGKGELLLPFVLQSAEVMKRAINTLEPLLSQEGARHRTCVLLATVQGDVHDIGKNLVDIILSNNGYKVVNAGIKVPAETIINLAREHKADVIGLSGLLVKSTLVMRDNLRRFREEGLRQPVLLGGAALTPRFVAEACAPEHQGPVVYCADAFAGLKAVRAHEEGGLVSTVWAAPTTSEAPRAAVEETGDEIHRCSTVPQAPFWGSRVVAAIDARSVLPFLNRQALFRGRWGYRRAGLSEAAYAELIDQQVAPLYEALVRRAIEDDNLVRLQVVYGYFPCCREGDALRVRDGTEDRMFHFPRQAAPPRRCLADYFRTAEEGGDLVGFFVASAGEALSREAQELFRADRYHDYLLLHGFGVELADALAERWHGVMLREMGLADEDASAAGPGTARRGARYGFGYSSCPDLDAHRTVFELLRPERIGVALTETMQLVPEQATTAMVAHHPQAGYFTV